MTFETDALLFDLDGTLIDSLAAVDRAWSAWCARNGLDPAEVIPKIHGRRAIDSLRAIAPHLDIQEEDAWLRQRESNDTEGVVAIPGAVEFVRSLTVPWAVVTSGTSDVARARMRAVGLPEPLSAVYGEDVLHGKPAPDPFRLGAERLGVDPARCLAFEDTLAGVRSAHAAGIRVVALTTSFAADELIEAEAIVDDFIQIRSERGLVTGPFRSTEKP